jgi:hypothetical protein
MEYLKYLGYAEQEVGFVALDRASKWGLLIVGPATKELLIYMESGNMMMPELKMTKVNGIFSFGIGKKVSFEETIESLEDDESGKTFESNKQEFFAVVKKTKTHRIFKNIFEDI